MSEQQQSEIVNEELAPVEEMPSEAQAVGTVPVQSQPGAELRAAREASGLSLIEVSSALKFSVRQLEALERDDFASLTGSTFVRGFVRSYARFLKLDEAPLLAMLEPHVPPAVAEVRPVETMGAAMPVASGRANYSKPLIVSFGIVAVSALVWFGWESYQASSRRDSAAATVTEPKPLANGGIASPANNPVALPENTVLPNEVPAAGAAPATPPATVAAPATAAPDERLLSFQFGDESWVEVRDAKQRVIFTGKYPGNTQQTVRGKPPFQLVIGNATAVKLRYEDRSIDLQPHIRAEVARLTLDDNSQ